MNDDGYEMFTDEHRRRWWWAMMAEQNATCPHASTEGIAERVICTRIHAFAARGKAAVPAMFCATLGSNSTIIDLRTCFLPVGATNVAR